MAVYAVTIFLSAFLLFQVEPLIAKIILPWFGGSAAVWTAVLLFFQLALLAGYAYAHGLIRFAKPRTQTASHLALLGASCLLLPIIPSPAWKPQEAAGDPTLRIIAALAVTVGLPYFLLSATSPLLQAWYVRHRERAVPYRLFALSNLGSMLALLSFPFLVEPRLSSRQQAYVWSFAYVAFAILCAFVAWRSRAFGAGKEEVESKEDQEKEEARVVARPRLAEICFWIALAACASALLLAVTTHMSQDIAPIPLLWVLPLALYLLTFIIAFESDVLYRRWLFMPLLAAALFTMARFMWAQSATKALLAAYAGGLFICCMVCHGELARRRPAPRYLTLFYLMVALGGALGGGFVALIAPHVFRTYLELPIALVVCASLAILALWRVDLEDAEVWLFRIVLIVAVGALATYLAQTERRNRAIFGLIARNFYGVLRTADDPPKTVDRVRTLYTARSCTDPSSWMIDGDTIRPTTMESIPESDAPCAQSRRRGQSRSAALGSAPAS
jgi:hypothetical protein